MCENAKETAFLRGLTVEPEWTQRFTEFFDETVKIGDILTLTYLNAGTGNHAIELSEKLGAKTEVFPVCETTEMAQIARVKAEVTNTAIDFSTTRPLGESEFVIADGSLQTPIEIPDLLKAAVSASNGRVAVFLPTLGSFGEVFSYFWEVLFELGIKNKDDAAEALVAGQTTVDSVENLLREFAMRGIKSHRKSLEFEFTSGREFAESPLMRTVFFPRWTAFVDEEDRERVIEVLARKIDEECDGLAFRMTVKATVVVAKH